MGLGVAARLGDYPLRNPADRSRPNPHGSSRRPGAPSRRSVRGLRRLTLEAGQAARFSRTSAFGRAARSAPGMTSFEPRIPEPMITRSVTAAAASTSNGQLAGRPIGVMRRIPCRSRPRLDRSRSPRPAHPARARRGARWQQLVPAAQVEPAPALGSADQSSHLVSRVRGPLTEAGPGRRNETSDTGH